MLSRILPLVLLLLALATPAWAQSNIEDADPATLVETATEFFRAGNYEEAAIYFQQAVNVDPHPVLMFNLARCHQEMGDVVTALRMLERLMTLEPPRAVEEASLERIGLLSGILVEQGYDPMSVTPATYTPRGYLVIETTPIRGMDVYIDGEFIGRSPVTTGLIDQGRHEVRVRDDAFHPVTAYVNVVGGQTLTRSYDLQERTQLNDYVPPSPGFLSVLAPDNGMRVMIDGVERGLTPLNAIGLPPGTYEIRVEGAGWEAYTSNVQVMEGEEAWVFARSVRTDDGTVPRSVRMGRVGNGLLIGGGLLSVAGITSGIMAKAAEQRYQNNPGDPARGDYRDSALSRALMADVAISAGVSTLITGAILKLSRRGPQTPYDLLGVDGLVMAPEVGPRRLGVQVNASF